MTETGSADRYVMSFPVGGKRGGKMTAYRLGVEAAAFAGQHVHAFDHQGQWCVTRQQVGYLWAKVARPGTLRTRG